MARIVKNKELVNTRLATSYGGWMYCTHCHTNIGYLCYVTYDRLQLNYVCNCGSKGSVALDFEDSVKGVCCEAHLIMQKNRFCCPEDESPLMTILPKKVKTYELEVTCKSCGRIYIEKEE